MRQHESIMKFGSPTFERFLVFISPEVRDQTSDKQLCRQAHLGVRGHFKAPEFNEPKAASGAIGRVQFVDTKLGPVCVSS
jgi:hypothetical protein